jgi:hypothetical protein
LGSSARTTRTISNANSSPTEGARAVVAMLEEAIARELAFADDLS